ncbi:MAG: YbhN family protein [Candidatus Nanohaloarchaea archaeon]
MDTDSRALWFGVTTLIFAAMIYFADVGKFLDAVRSAKLLPLVPAFFFGMVVFLIWANTWYSFFRQMNLDVSYRKTLKLFMAGNFMNSVTPLGQFGGEPFMAYVINRNTDASYERSLSAVFSADVVNGAPVLTFIFGGALYMLFFKSVNDLFLQVTYIALLVFLLGGSIIYTLWFRAGTIEDQVLSLLERLSGVLGRGESLVRKADRWTDRFEESFQMIGEEPEDLFRVAVIAHLSFLSQVFCLYFILFSLGMDPDFTPLYFVLAVSGLAQFSPTPGGSGTFEAAMASVLTVFMSLSFPVALIAAILFRMTTYWPGIALGYLALLSLDES